MSLNGVTFEKRTCRSRDDARIREALFTDGILTGCALTYAGANLTIGVGSYMVKGRQIAVDNPETIGSTPTYSNGYGRLKYVLNLATAASAATFAQGSAVWQYASTNSFAALTQQDINNGTNTLYEIEICRVKYTSGSITSIESQIAVALHDYVYSDTSETVGGNLWYIRKWKSGRVEMDMPTIIISNDSELTASAYAGGYYAETTLTIPFPDYRVAYVGHSMSWVRPGAMVCSFMNTETGVDQIAMFALQAAALTATGYLFTVSIHTEG